MLQCHHHSGAGMAASSSHVTPLAADWPHISTWSHLSEGRMPLTPKAGLQAGRQASEGAAHSPPPPSSLRQSPCEDITSHPQQVNPGVSMEKTSDCRAGALPGRRGLPTAPPSLLHPWHGDLDADILTGFCLRQSEPGDNCSIQKFSGQEGSICLHMTWKGIKGLPRTRGLMCIAILRVHREPSSISGAAVCPAPCVQLLPVHD